MAENKTQPTADSVEDFINKIQEDQKRQDSFAVLKVMQEVTGAAPRMWGDSIVGFGEYHYSYASGRQGDWFVVGFSPRKQNLVLYLSYFSHGFEQVETLLKKLGKHKTGKACLYINRLSEINLEALRELIQWTVQQRNIQP